MAFFKKSDQKFIVPEIVQTSAMDCGPAALRCILEGFGIHVSYGRLREACQTDVDGTSIDTLEEVAVQLGLNAEQIMIPQDHVLLDESESLPAISVVNLASGVTHFVVLWKRHGNHVQVMDPGTGRRWPLKKSILNELYIHQMPVPESDWHEWAKTEEFLNPLKKRIKNLGVNTNKALELVNISANHESFKGIACLDAATRMVDSIVDAGGIKRGKQATKLLSTLFEEELQNPSDAIPSGFWSVNPCEPDPEQGYSRLLMKGAVLVRATSVRERINTSKARTETTSESPKPLSPDLIAALEEPPAKPGRELLKFLKADGLLAPFALFLALLLSSFTVFIEALLFRGLLEIGAELALPEQRLGAMSFLLLFIFGTLLLEIPMESILLKFGRNLETRLRVAFLEKIPKLGDRYFHSRLTSDMAERSHSLVSIRNVPDIGASFVRSVFSLTLTTVGIAWIYPQGTWLAVFVAVLSVALPIAIQPMLTERDLRVRNHNAALSRFYLDALMGLIPVRAHAAEKSLRHEHENLLTEWMRARVSLLRASISVEGILALAGMGLAGWLMLDYFSYVGEAGSVLLLIYWIMKIPNLGSSVASVARQYPAQRNVTLRLFEPLMAPEESTHYDNIETESNDQVDKNEVKSDLKQDRSDLSEDKKVKTKKSTTKGYSSKNGIDISLYNVSVQAAGHTILHNLNLQIASCEHLAIVGPSGAGKSSLVGILLGWNMPSEGWVKVDQQLLESSWLEELRKNTAWLDPSVQLWNRSFYDNLYYGNSQNDSNSLPKVLKQSNLYDVLEHLPKGFQTQLGEGGAMLSGGQGQRIRMGRAMLGKNIRLAILDEPFRGLDRKQRHERLEIARNWWKNSTLLCVTHDVRETKDFERVIVIEEGRIAEDGNPKELLQNKESKYSSMIRADEQLDSDIWSGVNWKKMWLENGNLKEQK